MFPRASDTRVDGPCQGSEQVCFLVLVTCDLMAHSMYLELEVWGSGRDTELWALTLQIQKLLQVRFCLRLLSQFSPSRKAPIASYCLAFVNFLNPDRAEKYRRCFFQYAIMPRCQRGHSRHSKGSSTILCCTRNALLCLMLFLHDASLDSSMAECQRHFQHQRRASDFPDSAISTSFSLHGVARRLAVSWPTLWHSNLCICIRITPPVSDGCLLLSVCTGEST